MFSIYLFSKLFLKSYRIGFQKLYLEIHMNNLLKLIFEELENGLKKPKHPFRYVCLSTIKDNAPVQRMVVLRKKEKNTLTFYTDIRTPKVQQLKVNPNSSVLLYDNNKMLQIQLLGKIEMVETYPSSIWDSISPKAKKDYTSSLAPGSLIASPIDVEYDKKNVNFCMLKFTFNKIDYLKISKPHHIRAKFSFTNSNWEGTYLVP